MTQYIYILINPSLKGLLKIGRTDRSPEERAIELSNSSNMPTPFIVAYDEEVPDSQIAEKLVHDELMQQGFRVSDSREFFSIPLKNAIQVVSQVAQQLRESMAGTEGFSNDTEIDEGSTAEYYLQRGLDAMTGSANTLQDYTVAHGFFEKAIALGGDGAHVFLAHLYIVGNGVRQSSESALKILKAGGDKGDPRCYLAMWDIYAGNTQLDVRHEGNAEVCFQWYLDTAKEGVETNHLGDYLYHSYEMLGGDVTTWGNSRYPISKFPGKFVSTIIDIWVGRVQEAFREARDERLAGISLDQTATRLPQIRSATHYDVLELSVFLSSCVQDSYGPISQPAGPSLTRIRDEVREQYEIESAVRMARAAANSGLYKNARFNAFNPIAQLGGATKVKRFMEGITEKELEYCFSKAMNVKQTFNQYMSCISVPPAVAVLEYETGATQQRTPGFFSRFFS